jgi:hypothetical protein
MPGLLGYMLAIVVTLGGYFAGLHWLISPPDPWQPNARISASTAQQFAARKRAPVVKPAEAAVSETAASTESDTRLTSVETAASVAAGEDAAVVEPNAVTAQPDAIRPVVEPARVVRRVAVTKTRPGNRKPVERSTGRKLELMVLRTYERSDGKRFTRLLPLRSARNAMAFQPEDQW